MRRGIKWTPPPPLGMESLPGGYRIFGFRVRATKNRRVVARARGIWPWRWIDVGPHFFTLSLQMQEAVLLHEVGHLRAFHMEQRALLFPVAWTKWAIKVCHAQEFVADAFAVQRGYLIPLALFLQRVAIPIWDRCPPEDEVWKRFYPHPALRLGKLRGEFEEMGHVEAAD